MDKGYLGGGQDLWAEIEVRTIGASPGVGLHQVSLGLQATFLRRPPRAREAWVGPLFFSATAYLGKGREDTAASFLGSLQFSEPFLVFHSGWSAGFSPHLQGALPVSRSQVEAIEEMRAGDDLHLRVDFSVLVAGDAEPLPYRAQITRPISRSDWVKLLEQMNFRRTLLLEIPLPDDNSGPRSSKAAHFLQEAVRATGAGPAGLREAAGLCRDALESLREARGDKEQESLTWQKRSEEMELFGKEERVLLVRRALHRLTSAAKHPSPVEWTRSDAQSLVAMTAAILQLSG